MEKKEEFGQMIAQSEQEFRKAFDPSSPNYHGGLQVVVPTGGDRVPESMPTMYPQGYDPTKQQQVVDYGEQYRKVQANRNVYQNLKKQLAKLGPIVEAFLRHEDVFKNKGDVTNQKHIKIYKENIQKETISLKAVQDLLSTFIPTLQQMNAEGKECAKQLAQIIHQSGKKYENKESLTDFNFRLKRLSANTFSISQKCLQKMKDIKKQYSLKQKQAQQPKNQSA